MNSNLFPIVVLLPDDKIFVAANQQTMIYDWRTNTERRLPNIPNGVRVTYPMTGSALLLPLTPENDYTPEVLICGGSTASDRDQTGNSLSSQIPASSQCSRMVLTERGIAEGWKVEQMPEARMMPDMVLMPGGGESISATERLQSILNDEEYRDTHCQWCQDWCSRIRQC
jgi:hypothetical protein